VSDIGLLWMSVKLERCHTQNIYYVFNEILNLL